MDNIKKSFEELLEASKKQFQKELKEHEARVRYLSDATNMVAELYAYGQLYFSDDNFETLDIYGENREQAILSFLKARGADQKVFAALENENEESLETFTLGVTQANLDYLQNKRAKDNEVCGNVDIKEVAQFVVNEQIASVSLIQRTFNLGFVRASAVMDELEKSGIVSEPQGELGSRTVLVKSLSEIEFMR